MVRKNKESINIFYISVLNIQTNSILFITGEGEQKEQIQDAEDQDVS